MDIKTKDDIDMEYTQLKKQVLEKYFSRMNNMQRKAVFRIDGSVLIIAGAGSGKTTVLCNRIANMVLFGNAYNDNCTRNITPADEQFAIRFINGELQNDEAAGELSRIFGEGQIEPWRILAVTFTNKAASELKERLSNMGADVEGIWAKTFHSACVNILRRNIDSLEMGYNSSFTIYDTDESEKVIKLVMKDLNISEKALTAKTVHNTISRAKDKLITPERFSDRGKNGEPDYMLTSIKSIYANYQSRLAQANALDFDDIIMLTVRLFTQCPDVLSYWQHRFSHIMVDEYQDTNAAQYKLVSLLAGENGNLCVVGDEDQSIYRFRGATIENILSFEDEFSAEVIKLEQNYRSTENILNAANAVIKNNTQHKDKRLWSDLGEGEKIVLNRFASEQEESKFIAEKILENKKNGKPFNSNVILYRNNAQSRNAEIALSKSGIPYKIIGGVRFFERKEIKDIVAYLSVINNNYDEVRFMRIVNEPVRGIGAATQEEIIRIAHGMNMSPVDVMLESQSFPTLAKKAKSLVPVAEHFKELASCADDISDGIIIDEILERFGYREALAKEGIEGQVRLENISELKSNIMTFAKENEDATLPEFLEQVALVSDIDNYEADDDKVVLMTMHSAKGLEFDTVFLIGAEENIFPGYRSMFDPMEIEEERRLAYVAITRAKRNLYVTCARSRMLYGQTMRNKVSRFITEIPPQYMEYIDSTPATSSANAINVAPLKKNSGYLQSENKRYGQQIAASKSAPAQKVSYNAGERVRHKTFGDGTVISSKPMGGDCLLEIAFDTTGTKRLAAAFAKLEKI